MNNPRLLTGVLCTLFVSQATCAYSQTEKTIPLEELFEIAESRSIQFRPSLSAEEEAQKEVSVAKSALLPEINASLSLSYIGDGFITKRNFKDCQKAPIPHLGTGLGLNITQPLYTGGELTNAIKLADHKSIAARYATEMQRDNLRFRIAGYYLDVYKFHNLREVVVSNISQAKKVLEEMRHRYEEGMALQNDITRYELLVANLELQLVKIDNTINILGNNLSLTVGLPDGTTVVPDSAILSRSLPTAGEGWWQNEAVENSPGIKLAQKGIDISRTAEELVKSRRIPKIGLQAAWTMDGPILVEIPPINRNLSYWYVGVGINYNLSSLYKSNKSLAKSRVATRHAIESLDAAKENLCLGIREDYVRYLEAYEELKTCDKSVQLAETNYNTTFTRYTEGMALLTDLLDAVNSRLDAQQQLVNARIDIIYYYYKLLFTSGKI